jgi:fatty acid desaturase (delta-4 desaturase)
MPPSPDAQSLRLRRPTAVDKSVTDNDEATVPRVSELKDLAGKEVVIDGVIYDLTDFKHPGGDSVLIFGGNDVTVQYRMIHPYHTKKHLEKMRMVGKVKDFHSDYAWDTPFEREVKKEVFKIVRRGREFGTPGYIFRAFFYIGLMAYLQYLWVTTGPSWTLALFLGMSQASIGLNVQHDANHGAVSKKAWVNDVLGFGADFIGGSKWLWMMQHWTHHAFTNHHERDPDSFSAEPMMLFNDYPLKHPARRFWHKFQAVLFIPLLSFYWLSSVFNPQILDLRQRGAMGIGIVMENDFIKKRRKYAIAIRALYIYWNIVCPFLHSGFAFKVFAQIMFLGVSESLTLASLFSLSHNFDGSDRDPTKDYRETGEPVCWFKSQVETSSTYGGWLSGALTGGLNFQVEHHLFPRMSSAWYPYIAPTVREVCAKHGVKYAYYPWIWQNFISTVSYMHKAGTGANWKEFVNPLEGNL